MQFYTLLPDFCTGAEIFHGENLFRVECLSKLLLMAQLLCLKKKKVRKVSVHLVEGIEY